MILSDRDIKARLEKGDLVVDPITDWDLQLQPASLDVRLGTEFAMYQLPHLPCIDPRDKENIDAVTMPVELPEGEPFVLHPGEFVYRPTRCMPVELPALAHTAEYIKIPSDLVARVEGRSRLGRLAIVVHATAGFIDPGFEGTITLELSNLGRAAVKLYPGMRIGQLVFHTMTSPAERPYGSGRGSKYQGQRGAVPSRSGQDKDN